MKLYANYHTHTWRCGHARGTDREYIERAILEGTRILGFSDHAPYRFPNGSRSGIRMETGRLEEYFRTLTDLKREYAGQIRIHIGLEAEYCPALFGDLIGALRQYPCEYLLLGQHFFGSEDFNVASRPVSDPEVFRRYVDQVLEGLSTGLFTYLAHPDYVRWLGDGRTYRREMGRLCREAKTMGIPLEINVNGIRGRAHYPTKAFWTLAGQTGNDVILGTDHHYPEGIDLKNLGTDPYDPEIHGSMNIERRLNELITGCALNVVQTVPLRPIR